VAGRIVLAFCPEGILLNDGSRRLSLRSMDGAAIRERVQILRLEVAKIRAENTRYLQQPHHSYWDELLYKDREARLVQILKELTALTKKNPPD